MDGADEVKKNLRELQRRVLQAVKAGVYLAANNIMTDAKRRTPVDTGALRASGYVTPPQKSGGDVVSEIGFGGVATKYAVYQHELETTHEVGERRYLANAIDAASSTFTQDVFSIAKMAFKAGMVPSEIKQHATTPDNPEVERAKASARRDQIKKIRKQARSETKKETASRKKAIRGIRDQVRAYNKNSARRAKISKIRKQARRENKKDKR